MLNETLEKTMRRAKNIEYHTKASKYSNTYKVVSNTLNESLMDKKIKKYVQKDSKVRSNLDKKKNYGIIVENPDEIPVKIDFNNENTGIPFFKSLYMKLLKI